VSELPAITGYPTGSPGGRSGSDRELYMREVAERWSAFCRITDDLIAKSGDPKAASQLLKTINARPLEEVLRLFREGLREAALLGGGGIKSLTVALVREMARKKRVARRAGRR